MCIISFLNNNKGFPDDKNYYNSNKQHFQHLLKSEYSSIIFLGHKQLLVNFLATGQRLVHSSAAQQNKYVKFKITLSGFQEDVCVIYVFIYFHHAIFLGSF
jgi:hypothetical protein